MKSWISGCMGVWMAAVAGWALADAPLTAADFVAPETPVATGIPRPDTFLGFAVGEHHLRHDQLLRYMRALAASSARVSIATIGQTHEGRDLVHLTITAAERHDQLEQARRQHLQGDGPLVVWLGYSIHGNEASGSNVAPWVAWYLAVSEEPWVRELLAQTVVILDPSFNPDGMDRFANWSNAQAGTQPSADPNDWEHTEPWPNGRTNHYWFDLNRDWLPLVHPESRARVAQFQRWRPHVLTDHHEMGSNSTFFFQPGVPSRTNALTPQRNQELTDALGAFHAAAFDDAGELFFTRELFDDYYYGKGSTYPDIQGSVGILFEQASVRGKRIDTSYGQRTLAESMLNHYRASLSTLRGAHQHREDFFQFRREQDRQALEEAPDGAWLLGDDGDPQRAAELVDVMLRHDIVVYPLTEDVTAGDQAFVAGHAWVIPRTQRQATLVAAIFSQPREFKDNTFYDVSAFTLPLAYDLPFAATRSLPAHGDALTEIAPQAQATVLAATAPEPVAYAVPWGQHHAPGFLHALLQRDIRVRTSTVEITVATADGPLSLAPGALLIATGIQKDGGAVLRDVLRQVSRNHPVAVHAVTQGRSLAGSDLGSPRMVDTQQIRPLLVVGAGLNPYDAGEVWHLLDQRLGLTPTRVEWYRLGYVPLQDYTHLLMVEGDYSQLPKAVAERIVAWVQGGGTLVLSKGASVWSESLPWDEELLVSTLDPAQSQQAQPDDSDSDDANDDQRRAYGDYQDDVAQRIIGGAIMQLDVDTTHPLAYGLQRDTLPVLKSNLVTLRPTTTPYGTVAAYTDTPLLAGYASAENQQALQGKPAVTAQVYSQGRIIRFADNPLFRGHWLGSSRLYLNALFFSHLVQPTVLPAAPR